MESLHPSLRPVSPNDCALAVVIPLTREQFLADLVRADEKDFVRHFREQKGLQQAEAEFCWEIYEAEEAVFAEAVCCEAERLGVTVRFNAGLADLTDLLNRFPVVTLVTHWRFVPVEPADILDAPALLARLQSPEAGVQQAIRQALKLLDPQLLQTETTAQLSGEELRQRVAAAIGTIADEAERLYGDESASEGFQPEQMPNGLRNNLTRWEFEQVFPDCIAPARVIEFNDGMKTMAELIEAVPQDFSGLFDLTVCNSVIPAAPIRHRRQNCLVAANRKPAVLKARMYLYGLEISLLAKQPMPFIEVIKQVHTSKSSYNVKMGKLWNLFGKFFSSMQGRL